MAERKRKSATYAALREHMVEWSKGEGFNANPLGRLEEEVRWLCDRIEAVVEERAKCKKLKRRVAALESVVVSDGK